MHSHILICAHRVLQLGTHTLNPETFHNELSVGVWVNCFTNFGAEKKFWKGAKQSITLNYDIYFMRAL